MEKCSAFIVSHALRQFVQGEVQPDPVFVLGLFMDEFDHTNHSSSPAKSAGWDSAKDAAPLIYNVIH